MSWQPLLAGDLAALARAAALVIADSIATATVAPADAGHVALFWAYAAGVWDDDDTQRHYDAAVDRLLQRVAGTYQTYRLFGGGLAGDGWVLGHIASDADDALAVFDQALLDIVATTPWPAAYDLIEGLVGYGVYFVERMAAAPDLARRGLAHIVAHLRALQAANGGWLTKLAHMTPEHQHIAPAGYYNCGVAHGVAGIVALLGKVIECGDPPPDTAPMHAGATAWLWAQQLPASREGRFPPWVIPEQPPRPARTAWCYGDPGVATALWSAAARTGKSTAAAHELAREAATRAPAATAIADAGVCHGATGMGHVLNRCYQASGDPILRDAATAWFERALAMPTPTTPDLLEGTTGMGLALLAAITETEPSWDRLLLCDVPVLP